MQNNHWRSKSDAFIYFYKTMKRPSCTFSVLLTIVAVVLADAAAIVDVATPTAAAAVAVPATADAAPIVLAALIAILKKSKMFESKNKEKVQFKLEEQEVFLVKAIC